METIGLRSYLPEKYPEATMINAGRSTRVAYGGVLVTLLAAVLLGSCNTDFNPIQENDFHFSVFGFLDAAADSQFIRITPLRDSIALTPGRPLDATVTLEHPASGRKTTFRDSLFTFQTDLAERIAYNFWSAEPIEHDAIYRLAVTRSDGAASTATITMPPAFPDPELLLPEQRGTPSISFTAAIRIAGVERLADLRIVFTYRQPGQGPETANTLTLSYLDRLTTLPTGLGVAFRPYNDFFSSVSGCPIVDDVQVLIAAAGPDWPDFLSLDDETLALADVVTNVENGVGFIGGVSSKKLPWERLRGFLIGTQPTCVQCLTSFTNPSFCFGG